MQQEEVAAAALRQIPEAPPHALRNGRNKGRHPSTLKSLGAEFATVERHWECCSQLPDRAHASIDRRRTYNNKRTTAQQTVCSSFEQFPPLSSSFLPVLSGEATAPRTPPTSASGARRRR
eukprot:1548682-Alexandrium_andersonii.AAC.1